MRSFIQAGLLAVAVALMGTFSGYAPGADRAIQGEGMSVSSEVSPSDNVLAVYRVFARVNGRFTQKSVHATFEAARIEANYLHDTQGWTCRVTNNNQVVYSVGD
jgi:hypothetical protein